MGPGSACTSTCRCTDNSSVSRGTLIDTTGRHGNRTTVGVKAGTTIVSFSIT
jgi:hypothetical protein